MDHRMIFFSKFSILTDNLSNRLLTSSHIRFNNSLRNVSPFTLSSIQRLAIILKNRLFFSKKNFNLNFFCNYHTCNRVMQNHELNVSSNLSVLKNLVISILSVQDSYRNMLDLRITNNGGVLKPSI